MKRIFRGIILILALLLILAPCCFALSRYGSRGNEVTAIQRELTSRGYYFASIDGIFGKATENAVIQFQKDNGLRIDGIAGNETLSALGIESGGDSYNSADYHLLARIISAEARGEPYIGQGAVGAVVLKRVGQPAWPDTLAGVVDQKGAVCCL